MNNHIIKLMWNKRSRHLFFFIEILIIFFILTMTTLYSIDQLKNYFVSQGFETKNQYAVSGSFDSIKDSTQLATTKELLVQEISEMNEIESLSWVSQSKPYSNNNWGIGNDDLGFYYHSTFLVADINIVNTLGINIVKGRDFKIDDYNNKYIPIIVNQKMYDLIVDAKGHEMLDSLYLNHLEFQIIGVMDHYKQNSEFEEERNYFITLDHPNFIAMGFVTLTELMVKVKQDPNPAFQQNISKTYQDVARIDDVFITHLDATRKHDSAQYWVKLITIGIIALFLLINISLGLIGILSHGISRRKPEIGLRKALGATTGRIVSQFVAEVMLVAGIALFLGLVVILQIPYITDFEFEKKDLYFATAISLGFLIVLLLLSSIIPSLRGARIEPSTALHEE